MTKVITKSTHLLILMVMLLLMKTEFPMKFRSTLKRTLHQMMVQMWRLHLALVRKDSKLLLAENQQSMIKTGTLLAKANHNLWGFSKYSKVVEVPQLNKEMHQSTGKTVQPAKQAQVGNSEQRIAQPLTTTRTWT